MAEALSYTFSADAKYNEGRWKDPEFNDLLNKARIEPDKAKRDQLYAKAQEMLSDRGGIIIPFFLRDTTVLRADCSGFTPHTQNNNFNFEDLTCKGKEAE
jgi:peptide/nickel transport system substrate-binding protein